MHILWEWSWLNIDIIKEWKYVLDRLNSDIADYKSILEDEEITYDMKMFCYEKIEKKLKYKKLVEETLKRLNNIKY